MSPVPPEEPLGTFAALLLVVSASDRRALPGYGRQGWPSRRSQCNAVKSRCDRQRHVVKLVVVAVGVAFAVKRPPAVTRSPMR